MNQRMKGGITVRVTRETVPCCGVYRDEDAHTISGFAMRGWATYRLAAIGWCSTGACPIAGATPPSGETRSLRSGCSEETKLKERRRNCLDGVYSPT